MIKIGNNYINLGDLAAVVPMGADAISIFLRSGAQICLSTLTPEERAEIDASLNMMADAQKAGTKVEILEIERRRLRAELDHAELELDREDLEERRERRAKQRAALKAGETTPEP